MVSLRRVVICTDRLTEGAFEQMIPALGNVDIQPRVCVFEDHLVPPLFCAELVPRLQLFRL